MVVGKGAAFSQADAQLRRLIAATGLPFLATAMGRGVVPDGHACAVNAARSAALRGADIALIFGARCSAATCRIPVGACPELPAPAAAARRRMMPPLPDGPPLRFFAASLAIESADPANL